VAGAFISRLLILEQTKVQLNMLRTSLKQLLSPYGQRQKCQLFFNNIKETGYRAFGCTSTAKFSQGNLMTIFEVRDHLREMVGSRKQWQETGKLDAIDETSLMQQTAQSQDELPLRRPSDSFVQCVIPLGTDPIVREKFITYARGIRRGRLLESFDTFGVLVSYKHNMKPDLGDNQKSPFSFVTAMVDRIVFNPNAPQLSPFTNIYMSGNATWVGRTSIECTMHMDQEHEGKKHRLITAKYLFVARNPLTNKSAIVNPLKPVTEEEKQLFLLGESNKKHRQAEGQKSLLKTPPTEDERLIIHDIFLSTIDLKSGSFKMQEKSPNVVWMEKTKLKTLHVCQPEQRNVYNRIFGGFLMRNAYELAWSSACLYSKKIPPMCKVVDDILFLKPVDIGDILSLSSQIVYSKGSDIQIHVHAEVVKPDTGERATTNEFHFTFDTGVPDLPLVLPRTYAESMLYLNGKRRMENTN